MNMPVCLSNQFVVYLPCFSYVHVCSFCLFSIALVLVFVFVFAFMLSAVRVCIFEFIFVYVHLHAYVEVCLHPC